MISHLSKPLVPGIIPKEQPLELIVGAAQEKQNRYDKTLSLFFQKEQAAIDLDTQFGSVEITERKNELVAELDKQLSRMSKLDFSNPENIQRAERLFDPIYNDKAIIKAASDTVATKKIISIMDKWKEDGDEAYNSGNEMYMWNTIRENMSLSEEQYMQGMKNGGARPAEAIAFRNIHKEYSDIAAKMDMTYEASVTSPDGQGYFVSKKYGRLPVTDIMGALPNDAGLLAQAKVNAWYSQRGMSDAQVIAVQDDLYQKSIESTSEVIQANKRDSDDLKYQIKGVEANDVETLKYIKKNFLPNIDPLALSAEDKQEVLDFLKARKGALDDATVKNEKSLKELKVNRSSFMDEYQLKYDAEGRPISRSLSIDERENVGTQTYLQETKLGIANAFKIEKEEVELKEDGVASSYRDEQWKRDAAARKEQFDLNMKLIDLMSGGDESSSSSSSSSTKKTTPVSGKALIGAVGIEEKSSAKVKLDAFTQQVELLKLAVGEGMYGEGGTSFGKLQSDSGGMSNTAITEKLKEVEKNMTAFSNTDGDPLIKIGNGEIPYSEYITNNIVYKNYLEELKLNQGLYQAHTEFLQKLTDDVSNIRKWAPLPGSPFGSMPVGVMSKETINKYVADELEKYMVTQFTSQYSFGPHDTEKEPATALFKSLKSQAEVNLSTQLDVADVQTTDGKTLKKGTAISEVEPVNVIANQDGTYEMRVKFKANDQVKSAIVPITSDLVEEYRTKFPMALGNRIYSHLDMRRDYMNNPDVILKEPVYFPPIEMYGKKWVFAMKPETPEGRIILSEATANGQINFNDKSSYMEMDPNAAWEYITKSDTFSSEKSGTDQAIEMINEMLKQYK